MRSRICFFRLGSIGFTALDVPSCISQGRMYQNPACPASPASRSQFADGVDAQIYVKARELCVGRFDRLPIRDND